MSLRDALRTAVARCTPLKMQHATFPEKSATGVATSVQRQPATPHGIRVSCATDTAAGVQHGQLHGATFEDVPAWPMQPGSFTAHRLTADLLKAAMAVCDRHGDDDAKRQDMRVQCLETPPHLHADLLDHFIDKRRNFTKG